MQGQGLVRQGMQGRPCFCAHARAEVLFCSQVRVANDYQIMEGRLVIDCGEGWAVGLPAMPGALA